MNETVLFILLAAGMIAVAVTIWFAVHSRTLAKTGDAGAPGRPQERQAPMVQPEQLQPMSAATAAFPVPGPASYADNDSQSVQVLLQRAHEQLKTRQQRIENELARIDSLRDEREVVAEKLAALDVAMKALSITPAPDRRQVDHVFAAVANGTSAIHEE